MPRSDEIKYAMRGAEMDEYANETLRLKDAHAQMDMRCCARCQRGTRALPGPCGYDYSCPNPNCKHGRRS